MKGLLRGVIGIMVIFGACSSPRITVARYPCIVTLHNEVLCFEASGAMFRPERRYDRFILEVPVK